MRFLSFFKRFLVIVIPVCLIVALIYFLFIRPWILHMGATSSEAKMSMPGDNLVSSPNCKYTQAVTVKAPKEFVWGYVVQMGYRRAGWYNWDFINRLAAKDYFYENNKSTDRIIPELQTLKKGDKLQITPQAPAFDVADLKKEEYMLLTGNDKDKYIVRWTYMLKEVDKDTTRLYVRWESNLGDSFMIKAMNLLITEPGGAGIQQSQNLRGIKSRAEKDYSKINSNRKKI